MSITISKKLDMVARGVPPTINLSQYDSDFTLIFALYASTGTFTVESGTTAIIRGTKKSGNGYSADATLSTITIAGVSYPSVTVTGDNQMTAVAGKNNFEITLKKNDKELSSANFILLVERAPLDADTIIDETVLQELDAIIDAADRAEAAAEDAEASAASIDFGIDDTFTEPGQAADAAAVGKFKSAFEVTTDQFCNLFDEEPEIGGLTWNDGAEYSPVANDRWRSDFIPVTGGKTYTLTIRNTTSVFKYKSDYSFIGYSTESATATFTLASNVAYVRLMSINVPYEYGDVCFSESKYASLGYVPYKNPRDAQARFDISEILGKGFLNVELTAATDVDTLTQNGFYTWSGALAMTNLPAGVTTGAIINIRNADKPTVRHYQILLDYTTGEIYTRNKISGTFTEWQSDSFAVTELTAATDVDSLTKNGAYMWSGVLAMTNLPAGVSTGILLNIINRAKSNRHYQLVIDYSTQNIYTRNKKSGSFTEWQSFLPNEMTFSKTAGSMTINNGKAQYQILHQVDTTKNQNVWRLFKASFVESDGLHTIWESSDADGVIKIHGESDHVGGFHGDEQTTSIKILVDGSPIESSAVISKTNYKTIDILIESDVFHANTTYDSGATPAFLRNKILHFDEEGVRVMNNWELQEDLTLDTVFFGMLSVNRYDSADTDTEMITGFYTNADCKFYDAGDTTELSDKLTEATIMTIYGNSKISAKYMTPENYTAFVEYYSQSTSSRNKVYMGPVIAPGTGVAFENGTILRGDILFSI